MSTVEFPCPTHKTLDCNCSEGRKQRLAANAEVPARADPVNHPAHYTRGGVETRDFIAAKGLNFDRGSAVKYIVRAGHKDQAKEVEDLRKAISCLEHDIACIEARR